MRTRELRDVLEVLVLPNLWSALQELNKPRHFSRRKTRLLVKQAFDQLRLMTVDTKPAEPAPELPLDVQRTDTPEAVVNTSVIPDGEARPARGSG